MGKDDIRYISDSIGLFKHYKGRSKSSKKKKGGAYNWSQETLLTMAGSNPISSFHIFESGNFATGEELPKSSCYGGPPEASDIVRSNSRNFGQLESNIGKNLWKLNLELGVKPIDSKKHFMFKIDEIERLDKQINLGRKEKCILSV